MSYIYTLERNKKYKVGKQELDLRCLIIACKATVFDELWMILGIDDNLLFIKSMISGKHIAYGYCN